VNPLHLTPIREPHFIADNISSANVDCSPCSGKYTTDWEGVNLDTFDVSDVGAAYSQRAVVENNMSAGNGSSGILVEKQSRARRRNDLFQEQYQLWKA
jgi:hypothetical protein